MPTVKNILDYKSCEVYLIERDAIVFEAALMMNRFRIGSLVVTEGRAVVGIVTERDILRRVVAEGRESRQTRVRDIMTSPVAVCRYATTLEECRNVMTEQRIRHLPVVEDGELKGIITIGDLLAHEVKQHQHTIEYLEEYLFSVPPPSGQDIVAEQRRQ